MSAGPIYPHTHGPREFRPNARTEQFREVVEGAIGGFGETASQMAGFPIVLTPALPPGQVMAEVRNRRVYRVMIGEPSPIRTQVWDDLHRRLPWLRDGDDPLARLLAGVKGLP
jgi:hypothetical protein